MQEWMVVDYKLYSPGVLPLLPGTLWVSEQMPGRVYRSDVTSTLSETGHWASFNRPYFAQVYEAMGYAAFNATYEFLFGYTGYF